MTKKSIQELSIQFASDILKIKKALLPLGEPEIAKQIIRSGTSVGANIQEAQAAESRSDFIHKMKIAQKEFKESCYWLEVLSKEHPQLEISKMNSTVKDMDRLFRIILITAYKNKTDLKNANSKK
jgi:four helix bundle protein